MASCLSSDSDFLEYQNYWANGLPKVNTDAKQKKLAELMRMCIGSCTNIASNYIKVALDVLSAISTSADALLGRNMGKITSVHDVFIFCMTFVMS